MKHVPPAQPTALLGTTVLKCRPDPTTLLCIPSGSPVPHRKALADLRPLVLAPWALQTTPCVCFLPAAHPQPGPCLWDTPSVFSQPLGSVPTDC